MLRIYMVEKVYVWKAGSDKAVEKLIMDERMQYIHMRFGQGEGLPEHHANATVYMTVIQGMLTIGLDDQEAHGYGRGTVLVIPEGTKMNVGNKDQATLELIVVKVPAPGA